jgi:E3 ubiquitin-protein ligase RGLG
MGSFGSKESSSGRQQQQQHQDRGKNAVPGGQNRFANFGDDYHTLEQVSEIGSSMCNPCIAA